MTASGSEVPLNAPAIFLSLDALKDNWSFIVEKLYIGVRFDAAAGGGGGSCFGSGWLAGWLLLFLVVVIFLF